MARGNRSTTTATGVVSKDGQHLYRCEVERQYTGVFYVWSDSLAEARDDAEELMADFMNEPGELPEDDVFVRAAQQKPENGETVWSGGPDGYWDDWSD